MVAHLIIWREHMTPYPMFEWFPCNSFLKEFINRSTYGKVVTCLKFDFSMVCFWSWQLREWWPKPFLEVNNLHHPPYALPFFRISRSAFSPFVMERSKIM